MNQGFESKGLPPLAREEEQELRERWIGRSLGNCAIESLVGAGAMGVVFRGRGCLERRLLQQALVQLASWEQESQWWLRKSA